MIGLFVVLSWTAPALAQAPVSTTPDDPSPRLRPDWAVDVATASYVEAWEFNDSVEHLTGFAAGVDRRVWRGVAIRAEGVMLYVRQAGDDTWLRGATIAVRTRRRLRAVGIYVDVGGGAATAARRVPPTGTRFNYLAHLGGGAEVPISRAHVTAGVRWVHVSNSGIEGRLRNPDIQSLGAFAGLGWRF